MPVSNPVLEARGVRKQYGNVVALGDASVEIAAGEIVALVGQNGAGKSTLVGILSGRLKPDGGGLYLEGEPVSAHDLSRQGSAVAVVQQELSLVPTLTIGQNVFLGSNNNVGAFYSASLAGRRARPFLEMAGLGDVDPDMLAGRLSIGEQQLVELARALARDAKVLILDEPTAALSDPEIARVLTVVKDLRERGRSVVYISHRLNEVMELADRVVVVRDGRSLAPLERRDLTLAGIIEAMLGRKLEALYPEGDRIIGGQELIRLEEVRAEGIDSSISLSIRQGEIHGLAGQLGSAAAKVLEVIAGLRPITEGAIYLNGVKQSVRGPRGAARRGIAYCSDDRKRDGIFGVRSVQDNLTAPGLGSVTRAGWILRGSERRFAARLAETFGVTAGRMGHPVESLSGGNQQKVVLGKWLGIMPKVLLINEPTRGVDVGARSDIYLHLRRLADEGLTIIFTSSETDEVIGLADNVSSFYRGTYLRTAPASSLDSKTLEHELSSPESLETALENR